MYLAPAWTHGLRRWDAGRAGGLSRKRSHRNAAWSRGIRPGGARRISCARRRLHRLPYHIAWQAVCGGQAFKLPVGTLYSTNITPDKETGIGEWTDDEFVKAMHEGVDRNGTRLYPAFPYSAYTLLTRNDVLAIKAYLFSLKPVHDRPPENDMSFPFNQRYLMWFWNVLYNPAQRFQPNIDRAPAWNRGAYVVEALGHCGECHTPRTLLQGLDAGKKFGGR